MAAITDAPAARATPWHLWAVGVLSLLWNSFGAYDYCMSHLQGDAYFRQVGMSAQQIADMHASPAWLEVFWALGVWGAVAGSVLLLARSRWAYPAFAGSLLGAVVSMAYGMMRAGGLGPQVVMGIVIAVVAALLLAYAHLMRRRGVLA